MTTRREMLQKARTSYCAACGTGSRQSYAAMARHSGTGNLRMLDILTKAFKIRLRLDQEPRTLEYGQAEPLNSSPDGTVAPPRSGPAMNYECSGKRQHYDVGPMGFPESPPFTARGALTAPVRVKQPQRSRNYLRARWGETQPRESNLPDVAPIGTRTSYESRKATKFERLIHGVQVKRKLAGETHGR